LINEQTVSTCAIFKFLGGVGIFGQNSKLQKEFSNLSHHFKIRITFFFIKIDHWDNKNFLVFVDSTNIFNMTFTDADEGNNQICGDIQYPEEISPIDLVFLHNNSVLDVEITTNLDSNLGSWGIFNLTLTAYLCDQSCDLCSSNGPLACLSCPIGYYLETDNSCQICNVIACPLICNSTQVIFNYACVNNCPENYFLGKNKTCIECDESCKTCNDASNKNCLSCPNTTFLFEGTCLEECPNNTYKNLEQRACSPCDHTCQSCVGPNQDDCTSCENKTRTFANVSFNSMFLCNTGICECITGFYDDSASIYCFGIIHYYLTLI